MSNRLVKYYSSHDTWMNFFVSFLVILLLYQFKYGLGMLVPTNVGWLMWGDFAGCVTGNVIFRNEPWGFPLGNVTGYYYPIGTNVSEVLPLVVKLLSPLLPENFQYIGLFLFSGHLLLAWFTLKIFRHFGIVGLAQLTGTILIVLNTVLLYRFIHPGLTAQWLIVASFWLYLKSGEHNNSNRLMVWQGAVMVAGGLIFPYLAIMLSAFVAALGVKLWLVDRKITALKFWSFLITSTFAVAVSWYAIGLIDFSSSVEMGVGKAYGVYGWNLNSFFNGYDLDGNGYYQTNNLSNFLPALPHVTWHQYEGFSYLGVGIMFLCLVAAVMLIRRKSSNGPAQEGLKMKFWPILIAVALLTVFAISNVVTFNDHILFTIPIPGLIQKFGDIFRASGRFIWPAYYLLLFAVILFLAKVFNTRMAACLFIIALVMQVYDIKKMIFTKHFSYEKYHSPLHDELWQELLSSFDRIMFFPPYLTSNLTHDDYRYFSYFAASDKKQINTGYLARIDSKSVEHYTHQMQTELREPFIHDDGLYVSTFAWAPDLFKAYFGGKIEMAVLDGYLVFFSAKFKEQLAPIITRIKEQNDQTAMSDLFALVDPTPIQSVPASREMRTNMYEVYTISDLAFIKGWAFIENSVGHEADSISVFLRSAKRTWYVACIQLATPDVADFFHDPTLQRTGFLSAVNTKSLGRQPLQIGVQIYNKNTGMAAMQWTNSFIDFADTFAEPIEMGAPPIPSENVKMNFDAVDIVKNDITLSGWAFVDKGKTNLKMQVVFFSDSTTYAVSPNTINRDDVAKHFNNPALANVGFRVKVKSDLLKKGIYGVGILLTDTVKQKTYFQKGQNVLIAGFPEFETPEPFATKTISGKDSILAFLDRVDVRDDNVEFEGWAFINKVSTNHAKVWLLLESNGFNYRVEVEPQKRDDIKDYFKLDYSVDLAGFRVKFKKDKLPAGTYRTGVLMLNKENQQTSSKYFDNVIEVN